MIRCGEVSTIFLKVNFLKGKSAQLEVQIKRNRSGSRLIFLTREHFIFAALLSNNVETRLQNT